MASPTPPIIDFNFYIFVQDEDDDMAGPGGLGGLGGLFNDPDLLTAFQDPEVANAFQVSTL
jgi:hypothetical protein